MIIRADKNYETNSAYPNLDWYNDGTVLYVVDETTPEGVVLANKIKSAAPYYDFVLDAEGDLIDITELPKPTLPEFASVEEINREVKRRIKLKYDIDAENKASRLFRVNTNDPYVIAMDSYIAECVTWGDNKKVELGFTAE